MRKKCGEEEEEDESDKRIEARDQQILVLKMFFCTKLLEAAKQGAQIQRGKNCQ